MDKPTSRYQHPYTRYERHADGGNGSTIINNASFGCAGGTGTVVINNTCASGGVSSIIKCGVQIDSKKRVFEDFEFLEESILSGKMAKCNLKFTKKLCVLGCYTRKFREYTEAGLFSGLEYLKCIGCTFESFRFFESFHKLEALSCTECVFNNPIAEDIKTLKILVCYKCNLKVIQSFPSLKWLNCSYCPVASIGYMKKLKTLFCQSCTRPDLVDVPNLVFVKGLVCDDWVQEDTVCCVKAVSGSTFCDMMNSEVAYGAIFDE